MPKSTGAVPDGAAEGACSFLERLDRFYSRLDAIGVGYSLETTPFAVGRAQALTEGWKSSSNPRGVESGAGANGMERNRRVRGRAVHRRGEGHDRDGVGQRGLWTGQFESVTLDGHGAVFCPIELGYDYSPWYTGGGDQALVDGRDWAGRFPRWRLAGQGAGHGRDSDLGSPQAITGLSTGIYLYQDAWIFEPESILRKGQRTDSPGSP